MSDGVCKSENRQTYKGAASQSHRNGSRTQGLYRHSLIKSEIGWSETPDARLQWMTVKAVEATNQNA